MSMADCSEREVKILQDVMAKVQTNCVRESATVSIFVQPMDNYPHSCANGSDIC